MFDVSLHFWLQVATEYNILFVFFLIVPNKILAGIVFEGLKRKID